MSDLDKINSIFNAKIDSIKSKDELQNLKTEFFGKNGQITNQFKNLGSLSAEDKKEFASSLNKLKDSLSKQIEKNPHVALLFRWLSHHRQITILGNAMKTSPKESHNYFSTLPR